MKLSDNEKSFVLRAVEGMQITGKDAEKIAIMHRKVVENCIDKELAELLSKIIKPYSDVVTSTYSKLIGISNNNESVNYTPVCKDNS